jgi:hypothetical protein
VLAQVDAPVDLALERLVVVDLADRERSYPARRSSVLMVTSDLGNALRECRTPMARG